MIDEYDVPLENAYYVGFYDEMIGFIRSLFESALKTNPYLEFSVITGCLRISKESIFTGLNNLEVRGIYKNTISNWFRDEVKQKDLTRMYNAMLSGNAEIFEGELSDQLQNTISYMDSGESFYHGFYLEYWRIWTILRDPTERLELEDTISLYFKHKLTIPPVILELKVADRYKELDDACETALAQSAEKTYYHDLAEDGYTEVICYGVAFYKKQVRVHVETKKLL